MKMKTPNKNRSWKLNIPSMTTNLKQGSKLNLKQDGKLNLKQGSKIPKFGQQRNEQQRNESKRIPRFGQQNEKTPIFGQRNENKGFGKLNIPNHEKNDHVGKLSIPSHDNYVGKLNIPNHFGKKDGKDSKFNWNKWK